jgi:predicted Zn-dependent protease
VAVAALGLLLACAVNPVTGKRQLVLVSEEQEIAMGREADPQIVAEYGLYDDAALAAYVDGVGQKMAKLSHRPQLPFTFRVLDSPVINAFALPGGYIYVTRGILAHMNNEAELAMVLGHEIAHVTARHGVAQQTNQTLFGAGLGIGTILSPEIARYGEALQSSLGLLFLKFGRDAENQADDVGVTYALAAGYDAETGARFFEVLDRQSQEAGETLPGWLSTHPAPADRVRKTRELAVARHPQHPEAKRVAEGDLKARIDGIVFGEDPRQGFFEGQVFKHPDLGIQLELPAGWPVENTPRALLAGAPDRTAVVQMTLEDAAGRDPLGYANAVAQGAGGMLARGGAEKIGGVPAWVGVIRLQNEGRTADVLAAFVQRREGMYQLIGQGNLGVHEAAMLKSFRSLADLGDDKARSIQANRIRVEPLPKPATLEQTFGRAGASPVPIGTVALLNNLQPGSALAAGFRLKVVRGTFRPAARPAGS